MIKNILVTGGAGYIGSHIIEILIKKNSNTAKCVQAVLDKIKQMSKKNLQDSFIEFCKQNKFEIDAINNICANNHIEKCTCETPVKLKLR